MKPWVHSRLISHRPPAQQGLQVAFDVEEIHHALRRSPLLLERRPERRGRDANGLANPRYIERPFCRTWLPKVNATDLEYPNPRGAPVQVIADVLDQAAEQRAAHH